MGIHEGHRQRMKARFADTGLDGMNDHNVLELLLFYALPRKDTNELAHKLISQFGSLSAVLEADTAELSKVDGIGESAAVLLSLVPQISRRYMEEISIPRKRIIYPEDVADYFKAKFLYETNELCYALFLDNSGSIISCKRVSNGVVNATDVGIRMLVELAMKNKAVDVIIAHNHPHGDVYPSREDEHSTELIKKALGLVDIRLVDHIIVAGNNYYSFSKNHLM